MRLWVLAALSIVGVYSDEYESHVIVREVRRDVAVEDIVHRNAQKTFTTAYRICPVNQSGPGGDILFVHWLDHEEHDSNQSQFIEEASTLARLGTCGLLVDAMWSAPQWFPTRDRSKDKQRVAFVGHDIGGIFGALLAGDESRVGVWILQAATPRWHERYLLGISANEPVREKMIADTARLKPIVHVAKLKGPVLFQFTDNDRFVPDRIAWLKEQLKLN